MNVAFCKKKPNAFWNKMAAAFVIDQNSRISSVSEREERRKSDKKNLQ